MKRIIFLCAFITLTIISFCQNSIEVYPSNWWVGMKNPKLQLMLHGKDIGSNNISIAYPGITVQKVHHPENQNYLFVDLVVASATKPGTAIIKLNSGTTVNFQLKARRHNKGIAYAQGVGSQDFIYLIMPDRFSNGD